MSELTVLTEPEVLVQPPSTPRTSTVIDTCVGTTLVVSDIHLASPVCRAEAFRKFLKKQDFQRLVILGDLFDHGDFRRLQKEHWNVLGTLRKISSPKRNIEIVWVEGNHDRHVIRVVSHMIGARVIRQHQRYVLKAGDRRILLMHGHQFDEFIQSRPVITAVATGIYNTVQRCGGGGKKVSRWLKYKSKTWINACEENYSRAIQFARRHEADMIVCGHTHSGLRSDVNGIRYVNTGSWVDLPSHYLVVTDKGVELQADWSEE